MQPYQETLEVLPDPFPTNKLPEIRDINGKLIARATASGARVYSITGASRMRPKAPDFDFKTERAAAKLDVELAAARLRRASVLLGNGTPITRETCEALVAFGKEQLHIIATCAPLLADR